MLRTTLIAVMLLLAMLGQGIAAMPAMASGFVCADDTLRDGQPPACEHAGCLEHGRCSQCTAGSCLIWAMPTSNSPTVILSARQHYLQAILDQVPAMAPVRIFRPPRLLAV
jgi:hypothetical protein